MYFWVLIAVKVLFVACLSLYILLLICLKYSKNIFESLIDTSGIGCIIFDQNGRYYTANTSARNILGFLNDIKPSYPLQDFLDFMYDNAVDADENLRNAIKHSLDQFDGQEESFREVVQLDNGRLCLIIMQKTRTNYTIMNVLDISRQWRQETTFNLLGEKNYQLLLAIEASKVGVLISTPKCEGNPISFANSAISEMTGLSKDKLIGKYWYQLCEGFDEGELEQNLKQAFQKQQPAEILLTKTNDEGRQHWYSMMITPVFDDAGILDLFIGVITDTTEFKVKEAQFFQAQKLEALGQLSAGIAHDFNNILSIIDGYARLATRNVMSNPALCEDYLGRVCQATQRGSALTRRMLTFSRHKVVADKVSELGQIVNDQKLLLSAVLDPSIQMNVVDWHEPINVKCAPDTIAQILMNLVINARDAIGDETGKIDIFMQKMPVTNIEEAVSHSLKSEYCAVISVIDTGCGMEPDVAQRIFDPFFTTKSAEKGTGLGMSVVYGLVKDMQGYIHVETAPGEGTAISIYLPVSNRNADQNPVPRLLDAGGYDLRGFTAIVVDDEPDIMEIMANILRESGMHVITASDGNAALEAQDEYEGRIDVLVTDVLMPDMHGMKLAELFCSIRPETQVVYVSGYPAISDESHMQIPENAHFLAKPVEYEKFMQLIFALLNKDHKTSDAVEVKDEINHWQSDLTLTIQPKKQNKKR